MTRSVVFLPILALAACEAPTNTQPTVPLVRWDAPTANHGNGVEFSPAVGPGSVAFLSDGAGNSCDIGLSAQSGAQLRSDFYRTNQDGGTTVHATDPASPLTLVVDGVTYEGVGHSTTMATLSPDYTDYVSVHVEALGAVTDPDGNRFRASCAANGRSYASLYDASIAVY